MNFDPNTFMNTVYEDALDTKVKPVPVGEYPAQITKVVAKSGLIGKGDRVGQIWAGMDVFVQINDPMLAEQLDREKVIVKYGVMFDLTEQSGLDMGKGKNIGLGRLREAVGQNTPGKPWSPNDLIGQSLRVHVTHRLDDKDQETIYAEVSKVAAL